MKSNWFWVVKPLIDATTPEVIQLQTTWTGIVPANKQAVSFTLIEGNATLDGVALEEWETVTWEAYHNPVLNEYVRTVSHTWAITPWVTTRLHIVWKD